MPVTLCFIKDKHKVMEHKIPLETYFAGLLQKVEWQIQEYEDTAADTLTLCRLCVDYLQEILGELKNFIISYPFASTEEEIHVQRRERDSNPRYSCPYTAFRVRPDRPLRHLSRSITNPSAGNSECKYSYFSQKKHFRDKKRFEFLFSPSQRISRFYCYFCEVLTRRQ